MTRYPEPGKCKKRLAKHIGAEDAAEIHRRLAERTIQVCCAFRKESGAELVVLYSGGSRYLMENWLGKNTRLLRQKGAHLGERMKKAFDWAFGRGAKRAILVGTDCPELSEEVLLEGFSLLSQCDLVLGPARDGGYYLIGLRRPCSALFENISWGSSKVLDETIQKARAVGLSTRFTRALSDLDTVEDLLLFQALIISKRNWEK